MAIHRLTSSTRQAVIRAQREWRAVKHLPIHPRTADGGAAKYQTLYSGYMVPESRTTPDAAESFPRDLFGIRMPTHLPAADSPAGADLFMPQRVDRVQPRGAACRKVAEHHPDGG